MFDGGPKRSTLRSCIEDFMENRRSKERIEITLNQGSQSRTKTKKSQERRRQGTDGETTGYSGTNQLKERGAEAFKYWESECRNNGPGQARGESRMKADWREREKVTQGGKGEYTGEEETRKLIYH